MGDGELRDLERTPGPSPSAAPDPAAEACPACGAARLWRLGSPPPGRALRAVLPQPIATALLLARDLSPREHATFALLGLGYDNRSIARELNISERTAKRHVTAILQKLRLESRLQAGLAALIAACCASRP